MTGLSPAALREHGERPALVTPDGSLTHAELAGRVDDAVVRLGGERRLVLLAARNHPDAVVLYLAALAGRHPLILVDAANDDAIARLVDAYDPDVVARPANRGSERWDVIERRAGTRHTLHPDLALLLSTSGSTGSPKLVRLSLANIESNADAIGAYLGLAPDDRAITSLPMAYCYGLSVINSHLQRGASVVLTDRSVIDPEFWHVLRESGSTSFAGVPYTFDLLDRIGFAAMRLPHLRRITQAGGRLDPRSVRRYAELGRRSGWDLVVMYGQTEATARMAYLPPSLAEARPESIGQPIPGGSFRLEADPGAPPGAGELVYTGPNVMLGYAEGPADLARGRTVRELRTGDYARRAPDGLYEIVGRRSEFLKIAGLRVDLRGVERLVERHGGRAAAVGSDERLTVFVEDGAGDSERLIRDALCLPAGALRVVAMPELPRLANGKLDRTALAARARDARSTGVCSGDGDALARVRTLFAATLARSEVDDADTFASLGGDSLSYVEITLGLEDILGHLPDGWESMSIAALGATARPSQGVRRTGWITSLTRWRSIEMSVALRALAIVLVVATHIGMITAAGGAHVLMAVAGFNFARFRLTPASRTDRLTFQLRAVARIALPAMLWVAALLLLTDEYELRHMLLINALVRDELWGNLWFIELLVYIGIVLAVVLAIPAVDRAERRWPFGFALAVLGVGLLFRFELLDFGVPYTKPVLWLFALGWAASRADRGWQRALVLATALASIPGYFDSVERNAVIVAGVLLLVCVPRVSIPAALARVAGPVAAASLYIYLVHWEVWPLFRDWYGVPSFVASLSAGIALWLGAAQAPRLMAVAGRWLRGAAIPSATTLRRAWE